MPAPTARLRAYRAAAYPQLEAGQSTYLAAQFEAIAQAISSSQQVMVQLDVQATPLVSAATDAAAATAGVPVNGLYHTSGTVKVRLT